MDVSQISLTEVQASTIQIGGWGVVYGDVHIHSPAEALESSPDPIIRNPYKALNAFTSDDADDFFGRESLTDKILSMLMPAIEETEGDRLLAVVGASGSGKSSVIRAGLLPRLLNQQGAVPGIRWWTVMRMRPGVGPFAALAAQLRQTDQLKSVTPLDLIRDLKADEYGLQRLTESVLAGYDRNARLLLFVDQFEELFVPYPEERADEPERFIKMLIEAIRVPHGRIVVVLTLRTDFYSRLINLDTVKDWLPRRQINVGHMSLLELRQAIVGPAERVGLAFEKGLVDHILGDIEGEPGALPLLQFALTQLYDVKDKQTLTLSGYDEIGGVRGALAKAAEASYEHLSDDQQLALKGALLRLVTLGEGSHDTRRRVELQELVTGTSDSELLSVALHRFVDRRLLTADYKLNSDDPIYEVSHEALITSWSRFQAWLDEDRDQQRLLRQLTQDAQRWKAEKHSTEFLAREIMLGRVNEHLEPGMLSVLEAEYLQASESALVAQRQAAANQMRLLVGTLTGFLLIVTILLVLAVNAQSAAEIERDRVQVARDDLATQVFTANLAASDASYAVNTLGNYLLDQAYIADGLFDCSRVAVAVEEYERVLDLAVEQSTYDLLSMKMNYNIGLTYSDAGATNCGPEYLEDAARYLDRAINIFEENIGREEWYEVGALAYYERGRLEVNMEDGQSALIDLTVFLELAEAHDPASDWLASRWDGYVDRTLAHMLIALNGAEEHWNAALADCQRVIDDFDDGVFDNAYVLALAYFRMGEVHYIQGNDEDAEASYLAVLDLDNAPDWEREQSIQRLEEIMQE